MKSVLLFAVLLIFFTTANAADTLITKLINSIYLQRVDPAAKFYYLLAFAKNPEFDRPDERDLTTEMKDKANQIPFNEFQFNILHDTSKLSWKDFDLEKAKCIERWPCSFYRTSYKVFHYISYKANDSVIRAVEDKNEIPILIKPGASKKQIEKAKKIAEEKYENRPIEEKNIYSFSKPIFSFKKDYVFIQLNNSDHGCYYVFNLLNNKWVKVLQWRCWVG